MCDVGWKDDKIVRTHVSYCMLAMFLQHIIYARLEPNQDLRVVFIQVK